MPLILLLILPCMLLADSKKELFYEYEGLSLKTKLESLNKTFPKGLHQFMYKNSKAINVLEKEKEKDFYKRMLKKESVYSISSNEIKNNQVVPISMTIQRAKFLIKKNRLQGMELNLTKANCLNARQKLLNKYGRPDSQNVATGSSVWFWMTGKQSLVLDEKLCNVHINWDKKSNVPGAKSKQ